MSIQAIDRVSVHRLTSGQVVVDLQTAVKELLENALDAEASSIVIIFRDHGVESFEVQDNGKGIQESDWPGIALKHHTSKLTSFSELTSVSTLGFRGEALSSLCGTATLSIATATAATAPAGTQLTFKHNGECIIGPKLARGQGTTVIVKELFKALPVRRKELMKNAKREFGKAIDLIQAYALIRTGTRFEVKNIVKAKSSMHLQMAPNPTVRANFSALFSAKILGTMMDLDLTLDVAPDKSVTKWSDDGDAGSTRVVVKGLISKPIIGNGRTSGNRQFFYVNGRPFSPTKVMKAFNEVYKSFLNGYFPAVVADFQLPPDTYDVNVSPDKRTIFLHSEGNLIATLKSALEDLFQPSRSMFPTAPEPSKQAASATQKTSPDLTPSRDDPEIPGSPAPSPPSNPPSIQSARTAVRPIPDSPSPAKRRRIENALRSPSLPSLPINVSTVTPGASKEESTPRSPSSPSREEGSLPAAVPHQSLPPPAATEISPTPSPPRSPSPVVQKPIFRQQTLNVTRDSWHLDKVVRAPKRNDVETLDLAEASAEGDEVDEELVDQSMERNERTREHSSVEPTPLCSEPAVPPVEPRPPSPNVLTIDDDGDESDDELEIIDPAVDSLQTGVPAVQDFEDEVERQEHLALLDTADDDGNVDQATFSKEVRGAKTLADTTLRVDLGRLAAAWTKVETHEKEQKVKEDSATSISASGSAAGLDQDAESAEAALSRTVTKADFEAMSVVGQFNHAFIIARRCTTSYSTAQRQDDLFIVDQHASDEKWNFEELQANTVIQSQRLIQPRSLNLPSQDEMIAIEHVELLRMNGFNIAIDEDAEMGNRVKLVSHPVSKDTKFGVDDLEELISLAEASSVGDVVRPSRIRRMFASRACRKSVMFGKALNSKQMSNILRHMGDMEQPWSCPHGRPTMRWLFELSLKHKMDGRDSLEALLQRLER